MLPLVMRAHKNDIIDYTTTPFYINKYFIITYFLFNNFKTDAA